MGDVEESAKQWVKWDPCEETRSIVQGWLDAKDMKNLTRAFGSRVAFGTAGLRAEMAAGTSCLNDLVILQTAQGLAKYLEATVGEKDAHNRGIVLGFDHRARGSLNSKRFALLTAAVCLSQKFKVYLFKDFCPTPFVPFAVKRLGACCGVMVTASHNPKDDNGFKVYWGNACQIIPPHDKGIAKSIDENLQPWQKSYEHVTEAFVRQHADLCSDPLDETAQAYYETIAAKFCRHKEENQSSNSSVKVAYTAMHGVGHRWAKESFKSFGLAPFFGVEAQIHPDPTFPTVEYPNPEEGAGALTLSMETAEANGCSIIVANDPDADRLAVAEKDQATGEWHIFTGNEIAALLGHWEWTNYSLAQSSSSGDAKKAKASRGAAMVASTVSSKMLRAMAAKEGFIFRECLTGFKWIGNSALSLADDGYDVIFSYEQAIGFCIGDNVPDKDGISAMAVFAEMAGQLKKQGKSCAQHLLELRNRYGFFVSNDGYVVSKDKALNDRVFAAMRNDGKYFSSLADGKYKVKSIRDLLAPGYDSSTSDKKPTLPVSNDNMITFEFENGCVMTLRMSGTEPKLKYYTEMSGADPDETARELQEIVDVGLLNGLLKDLTRKIE